MATTFAQSTALPPIFAECCDAEAVRLSLKGPWIADGRVWATDGRVAVWADLKTVAIPPDEAQAYSPDGRKLPDVAAFAARWSHGTESIPLPDGICGTMPCPECHGSGRSNHDPEYSCYDCDGAGTWPNFARVRVGTLDLAAGYVALLARHGVRTIRMPIQPDGPVRFDGDGFSGLLMPMRAEAV